MNRNLPALTTSRRADTLVSTFLRERIDALAGVKNQRQIAQEIGFKRPNVISMLKNGQLRVPLDKVPAIAKALKVDPAVLFRMVLEQYWPDRQEAVAAIFGTVATRNEVEILAHIRALTGEPDPSLTEDLERKLASVFCGTMADSPTRSVPESEAA